MKSARNNWSCSVTFVVAVVALMTAGSFMLAAADDAVNKDCLEIFKPVVSTLSAIGEAIAYRAHPLFVYVGLVFSAILCVAAVFGSSASYRLFLLSLAVAIAGQAVLVDRTLCDLLAAKLGWYGASYQVPLYQKEHLLVSMALPIFGASYYFGACSDLSLLYEAYNFSSQADF